MNEASKGQEQEWNGIEEEMPESRRPGSRRQLLGGVTGTMALGASGLFLPEWLDEAQAREGALDGANGGRRGKNHRGRFRKRSHGDKKHKDRDKNNGRNGAP